MSDIFWDTNLFIYLIEDYGELSERVALLRRRMLARGDRLYASSMTLGEVLVKPVETGNNQLRDEYEALITGWASILDFDQEAARRFARIRSDRSIKQPDAIQLACAAQAGIDLFITNDDRLSTKIVPGIQFITSLQRAFL